MFIDIAKLTKENITDIIIEGVDEHDCPVYADAFAVSVEVSENGQVTVLSEAEIAEFNKLHTDLIQEIALDRYLEE